MDDLAGRVQEIGPIFKKHFDPFTGNYDAEVLKAAAASRATTVVFFHTVEGLQTIDLSGRDDRLLGIILHLRRRLWIAIRQHKGFWYNFDSTKATPLVFCDGAPGLHMFLDKVVEEGEVVAVVLKPAPAARIMLAQRPPLSFTKFEYWKNWLFGYTTSSSFDSCNKIEGLPRQSHLLMQSRVWEKKHSYDHAEEELFGERSGC